MFYPCHFFLKIFCEYSTTSIYVLSPISVNSIYGIQRLTSFCKSQNDFQGGRFAEMRKEQMRNAFWVRWFTIKENVIQECRKLENV